MSGRLRALGFDAGMLILRVSAAAFMIYGHGWPKLSRWESLSVKFADPFGLGPAASLALAIFAEFVCSLAVAFGLFTRFTAIPLVVTMAVAAFHAHAGDPFRQKELALVYGVVFLFIALAGAGRFSLDRLVWKRFGSPAGSGTAARLNTAP